MEQTKALLEKILGNEVTGFIFVFGCAIGATIGIVGGYWVAYKTFIYIGAY